MNLMLQEASKWLESSNEEASCYIVKDFSPLELDMIKEKH
jgi:hypothetical protein